MATLASEGALKSEREAGPGCASLEAVAGGWVCRGSCWRVLSRGLALWVKVIPLAAAGRVPGAPPPPKSVTPPDQS